MCNEEHHNVSSTVNIIWLKIINEMKPERERHLKDLFVNERKIIKWMLKELEMMV
jgi:hypothetical protein